MTYPLVLLADNRDISQAAFGRAQELRRMIAHSVECREDYVSAHSLDPSFCLPGGNWGKNPQNDFVRAYRHVRDGGYEVLNRLRLCVPFFSGYDLLRLSHKPAPSSAESVPPDHDLWLKANRSEPDQWVAHWVAATKKLSPSLRFSPPLMLGEIGWRVDDIVVNHDTYVYQERLNILNECGIIDWLRQLGREPRILEIGGGYGALAFALRRIFPSASCMICDLPESLLFAGMYLTLCERDDVRLVEADDISTGGTRHSVTLLPNYLLHLLLDGGASFDLIINTLSMSEMTEAQVQVYAGAITRMIGQSGVFFEQNQDNRAIGLIDCKKYIRGHFAWSCRLKPQSAAMTEGRADLWANAKPPFGPDVADARTRLDDLEEFLNQRKQHIDSIVATVQERSQRLHAVEKTLEERGHRSDAVERTLEERSQRLVSLETTVNQQMARLDSLQERLQRAAKALKLLSWIQTALERLRAAFYRSNSA